ncbi:Na+/H+ antiporter NhaA [Streptomyces sp. NPDC101225]|uniref:Na+/H+ antiporter NhaA n=1 Tax=Streptomyces sp. NPDC101225 TaxID=3366135 RepID=UPI00382CCBB8
MSMAEHAGCHDRGRAPVVAPLAGIGFTVSLLIANLAFTGRPLQEAVVGITRDGVAG